MVLGYTIYGGQGSLKGTIFYLVGRSRENQGLLGRSREKGYHILLGRSRENQDLLGSCKGKKRHSGLIG